MLLRLKLTTSNSNCINWYLCVDESVSFVYNNNVPTGRIYETDPKKTTIPTHKSRTYDFIHFTELKKKVRGKIEKNTCSCKWFFIFNFNHINKNVEFDSHYHWNTIEITILNHGFAAVCTALNHKTAVGRGTNLKSIGWNVVFCSSAIIGRKRNGRERK